jgi:hypothetical protein
MDSNPHVHSYPGCLPYPAAKEYYKNESAFVVIGYFKDSDPESRRYHGMGIIRGASAWKRTQNTTVTGDIL